MDIKKVRTDLLDSDAGDMRRRRGIIGASLIGLAAMAAVTLRQTGIIRRLPDLPGSGAEQVTLSNTAFATGVPDGALSMVSLAANIPLAAAGTANRASKQPWLPMLAAGKAAAESLVSLWYLRREQRFCSYCLVAAAANFVVFGLAIPEARRVARLQGHPATKRAANV